MLGQSPIGVVLLAKDFEATRAFYRDRIGLRIQTDSESAVTFICGGATRLTITASETGTKDEQTQASWQVEDLRSEIDELRQRGVEIEEIDSGGITTIDGIADMDGVLHAWFTDPAGNSMGIEQPKS